MCVPGCGRASGQTRVHVAGSLCGSEPVHALLCVSGARSLQARPITQGVGQAS